MLLVEEDRHVRLAVISEPTVGDEVGNKRALFGVFDETVFQELHEIPVFDAGIIGLLIEQLLL